MADRQPQWFHFGPWVFDIDAALALIAATPRETQQLDVPAWATAYSLHHLDNPQRLAVSLIGPTPDAVDRLYAMSTDLTNPVILGLVRVGDGPPAGLLIDGVHRLYHAWRKGTPHLPAYVLTAEETQAVQHNKLLDPGGTSLISPASRSPHNPHRRSHGATMTHLMPWQRPCNCRCPVHANGTRLTYDEPDCACTITCVTQPITLLADRWGCALFLDQNGGLWQVPALPGGTWDWETPEISTPGTTSTTRAWCSRAGCGSSFTWSRTAKTSTSKPANPRWAARVGGPLAFCASRPLGRQPCTKRLGPPTTSPVTATAPFTRPAAVGLQRAGLPVPDQLRQPAHDRARPADQQRAVPRRPPRALVRARLAAGALGLALRDPVTDGHPLADADALVTKLLSEADARLRVVTHYL
ncbi:hypothetical protein ACFQS1_37035 [Paractinoplanes rhizophilus]|uniref:Uncharacterized protein n=1 Tax=Paractinoplanes rhizophilus TaxID=1416877 RepID=A0ABW2I3Y5_9ACTN